MHGYCPSGFKVRCIVESCLEDPRVMTKPVARTLGGSPVEVALARSRLRAPGSASVLVLALDTLLQASVAGPVAANLGAPLLLTGGDRLATAVIAENQRLGAGRAVVVGTSPDAHLDVRRGDGLAIERVGMTSAEVGQWLPDRTGGDRVMGVEPVACPRPWHRPAPRSPASWACHWWSASTPLAPSTPCEERCASRSTGSSR